MEKSAVRLTAQSKTVSLAILKKTTPAITAIWDIRWSTTTRNVWKEPIPTSIAQLPLTLMAAPPVMPLPVSAALKDSATSLRLKVVVRTLQTTMLAAFLTMGPAILNANNVRRDICYPVANATPSPAAYKIVPTVSEANPALSAMKGTHSVTQRAPVRPTPQTAHLTVWPAKTGLAQNA